jgi:predicted RNase H-like HicB family nuclease
MKVVQFNVIFELDEDGYYVASVPAIPGCYTQGKTLEEAKKRVKEVIELCLEEDSSYARVLPSTFVGIDRITIHA